MFCFQTKEDCLFRFIAVKVKKIKNVVVNVSVIEVDFLFHANLLSKTPPSVFCPARLIFLIEPFICLRHDYFCPNISPAAININIVCNNFQIFHSYSCQTSCCVKFIYCEVMKLIS